MKTFVSSNARWTKEQIVIEVNETLYNEGNVPLTASMISDYDAQSFVDTYYQWLQESVGRSEEETLNAETYWQTTWYHDVIRKTFGGVQILRA